MPESRTISLKITIDAKGATHYIEQLVGSIKNLSVSTEKIKSAPLNAMENISGHLVMRIGALVGAFHTLKATMGSVLTASNESEAASAALAQALLQQKFLKSSF